MLNGGSQAGEGDPPRLVLDLLVKEVAARASDPAFVAETDTIAKRLTIPLPSAVMWSHTGAAVVQHCTELVDAGRRREAAALLAGYLLAVVRWKRPWTPCRTVLRILAHAGASGNGR